MKLKPLKKLNGHRAWCGPGALSILTGRSVNHCARIIAKRRNKRYWYHGHGTSKQVRGTWFSEIRDALDDMGFSMHGVKFKRGTTLHRYMTDRGGEQWKSAMLIEVSNHWMVAHRDTLSDNSMTCHHSEHKQRLTRIRDGWIVRTKRKR